MASDERLLFRDLEIGARFRFGSPDSTVKSSGFGPDRVLVKKGERTYHVERLGGTLTVKSVMVPVVRVARYNPGAGNDAFDVYLRGKLIDTVFAKGYTVDEMKRSLINHDGYDSAIVVKKARKKHQPSGLRGHHVTANPAGRGSYDDRTAKDVVDHELAKAARSSNQAVKRTATAFKSPKPGVERSLVMMINGLCEYADSYRHEYNSTIGDDAILGDEAWYDVISGIKSMLNGDIGRLDAGVIDAMLREIANVAGYYGDQL